MSACSLRILDGLPLTDMEPNWQVSLGRRGLLVPNRLYIGYAAEGGTWMFMDGEQVPRRYRVIDPRTGAVIREGTRAAANESIPDDSGEPRIYICCDEAVVLHSVSRIAD